MDRVKVKQLLKTLGISQEEEVALTLNEVAKQLETFNKGINIQPLLDSFANLKQELETKTGARLASLESRLAELTNLISDDSTLKEIKLLSNEINTLKSNKLEFANQIKDTEARLLAVIQTAKTIDALEDEKEKEELQKQFASFEIQVKNLKQQLQEKGGGSMGRKLTFGGTNYLTKYTDVNYKAGANVTFTVANNNTTKMVDVTIAATGGSGSGIVRSVQSISASQAADAASTTDYVYLCSGTMTLTLPDATTNTNLYTVKNVGVATVTINTTSSQTIDGALTIVMPVQYTSVDLISDGANWKVT